MLVPAWALALVMLCVGCPKANGQCWEHARCQDLSSEENILCKSDLTPPSGSDSPLDSHYGHRSYSMEHFRWGKPVGRKRRPIKVFAGTAEEDSTEAYPTEVRRGLGSDLDYPVGETELAGDHPQSSLQEKKNQRYKMGHFRWNAPPAPTTKRYGGFMKSWGDRDQKPLLTLFRNVINKDGQQKKNSADVQ
uniref:Proopiomelanocortin a n=1 Tax=Scleropages formosus TaxID=113540 RepID=A0A8C9W7E2_SCLFO